MTGRGPQGGLLGFLAVMGMLLSGGGAWAVPVSEVPVVLDQPGVYTVTQDLEYTGSGPAITITASGVVLDLNGHTLTGAFVLGSIGILAQGVANVTIQNGTVTKFGTGIQLDACIFCCVTNMVLFNNGLGILLTSSLANTVTNNTATNNGSGIVLQFSAANIIVSNTASFNRFFGIWLYNSNGNYVLFNTANNNRSSGILLQYDNDGNLVLGNVCNFNAVGILVYSGSNFNGLFNNTALSNTVCDLIDANTNCDTNFWFGNVFVKANQACIQ